MNYTQRLNGLNERQAALDLEFQAIRPEFERHITDKTIPVQERWQTWINATDKLKDPVDGSYGGPGPFTGDWIEEHRLDSEWDRGVVYLWADLLDPKNWSESELQDLKDDHNCTLEDMQEEILVGNCLGGTHDW